MENTAFDDPSWRSNPRMPLLSELRDLFWQAYNGRGRQTAVAAAASPQSEAKDDSVEHQTVGA
jgi:hypothetical protein